MDMQNNLTTLINIFTSFFSQWSQNKNSALQQWLLCMYGVHYSVMQACVVDVILSVYFL